MPRRFALLVLAATPMLGCTATVRRGLATTEAASDLEQVTRSQENERDPAVSPDGEHLAFESTPSLAASPSVETIPLGGAGRLDPPRVVYGASGRQPAWLPDGSGLVFLSTAEGAPHVVMVRTIGASGVGSPAEIGSHGLVGVWPAIAGDGRRVAVAFPRLDVFHTGWDHDRLYDAALGVSDLDGSGLVLLGDGMDPAWSPRGRRIAFAREVGGHSHVFVAVADGKDPVQITDGPEDDTQPAWSPDGKRIVFCSGPAGDDRSARANLFVSNADGSGLVQLTEGDRATGRPSWARDGYVYFHADAGGHFHVWRLRPRAASP